MPLPIVFCRGLAFVRNTVDQTNVNRRIRHLIIQTCAQYAHYGLGAITGTRNEEEQFGLPRAHGESAVIERNTQSPLAIENLREGENDSRAACCATQVEERAGGGQLPHISHDGVSTPAIALTPQLKDQLLHFARGSREMDFVAPVFNRLIKMLDHEASALKQQKLGLDASATPRAIEALETQRCRALDKLSALRACWKTLEDVELGSGQRFQETVFEQLARAKLVPRPISREPTSEEVDRRLAETIGCQEALSWSTGHASSVASLPEQRSETSEAAKLRLTAELDAAREEMIACRKDWAGRHAQAAVREEAKAVKTRGFEYPPTEIVDQFALIERTEAIDAVSLAEKAYQSVKRRMRRRDLAIKRELEDDSEFSFDVDVDVDKSDEEGTPDDRPDHENKLRLTRRWQKRQGNVLPLIDPSKPSRPPASCPGSHLSWPTMNSGVTTKQEELKLIKRSQMWMRLQKESAVAGLKGRERSTFPPRKKRFMRRRLNNFLAARPIHFRMTNNEPRHRKSRPRGATDSSRLSSHGEFEFWDREEDPPAQSQAGGSTSDAGPFEKSDGSRKRDDAANRRDHDSENSSKRQTTPSQSRKRGAEDKDLASPSKRVQI